jgi:hypothetical protein
MKEKTSPMTACVNIATALGELLAAYFWGLVGLIFVLPMLLVVSVWDIILRRKDSDENGTKLSRR